MPDEPIQPVPVQPAPMSDTKIHRTRIGEVGDTAISAAKFASALTTDQIVKIIALGLVLVLVAIAGILVWRMIEAPKDAIGMVLRSTEDRDERARAAAELRDERNRSHLAAEAEKTRLAAASEGERNRQHDLARDKFYADELSSRDRLLREELAKNRETMATFSAELTEWRRRMGAKFGAEIGEVIRWLAAPQQAPMPRVKGPAG